MPWYGLRRQPNFSSYPTKNTHRLHINNESVNVFTQTMALESETCVKKILGKIQFLNATADGRVTIWIQTVTASSRGRALEKEWKITVCACPDSSRIKCYFPKNKNNLRHESVVKKLYVCITSSIPAHAQTLLGVWSPQKKVIFYAKCSQYPTTTHKKPYPQQNV